MSDASRACVRARGMGGGCVIELFLLRKRERRDEFGLVVRKRHEMDDQRARVPIERNITGTRMSSRSRRRHRL